MPFDILQSSKALAIIRDKIDEAHYVFFKSIVDDIANFRQALLGINRDDIGGLKIANQPIASQLGDQFVFVMNKAGQIAILQREPEFGYANLDVGGPKHIFGTPPQAQFVKTTDTAGVGFYVWDAALFNNEPDMFTTAGGVTTITNRGYYRFLAHAVAENVAGAKTLVRMVVSTNGVGNTVGSHGPLLPAAGLFSHVLFFEAELYPGDTVIVELVTGNTRIGAGGDNRSRLYCTRIN